MKIKKTFSRRVSLPAGDSFITSLEIEFQADDDKVEEATQRVRKLLISEARKDIMAFYNEAKNKEKQNV